MGGTGLGASHTDAMKKGGWVRGRSASCAVAPGGSWKEAFRRAGGPWSEDERQYVQAVLDRYLWLPVTPGQLGRRDRRCARALYVRGVPLAVVEKALLVAATRLVFRSRDAEPLPPVRALHYFLPVIEEVLETELAPGYAEYLAGRLSPFAEAKRGVARGESP